MVGATALSALAGLALAAEGLLRLAPSLQPETAQLRLHWWATEPEIPKISHPYLGFVHPANLVGEVRYRDFDFRFSTDDRGFRNRETVAGATEVVVVGDSQAFGFGVDDGDSWAGILQDELGTDRVVNLGINGSAPLQQARVLETFDEDLQPSMILFGLFPGNALGATGDFQGWLNAGQPLPFVDFKQEGGGIPWWKRMVRTGIRHSRLLLYVRTIADRLRTPYPGTTLEVAGERVSFAPYVYAGHAAIARPGEPSFEGVFQGIEQARSLAASEGSRFLVVVFPTKEEIYLPLFGRPAPQVTAPFLEALDQRGIPHVDLMPAFRARAADGESLFLPTDIHPNEAGYALIADEVLRRLESSHALAADEVAPH